MASKLTVDEIGADEFDRCWRDKAWFRGIAGAARDHARERGHYAVANIIAALTPDALGNRRADGDFIRHERDAVMFARMAHKGWRAYRVMVGE